MKANIEGQRITKVRLSTPEEKASVYWDEDFTVLVLENGIRLFASGDREGNCPGVLYGIDGEKEFSLE